MTSFNFRGNTKDLGFHVLVQEHKENPTVIGATAEFSYNNYVISANSMLDTDGVNVYKKDEDKFVSFHNCNSIQQAIDYVNTLSEDTTNLTEEVNVTELFIKAMLQQGVEINRQVTRNDQYGIITEEEALLNEENQTFSVIMVAPENKAYFYTDCDFMLRNSPFGVILKMLGFNKVTISDKPNPNENNTPVLLTTEQEVIDYIISLAKTIF